MDYQRLREDLIEYLGTAIINTPVAIVELSNVENATDDELVSIAIETGFNLDDYNIKIK